MIQVERIRVVNRYPLRNEGKFVVYWMQQSQRIDYNHALEYAIWRANQLDLPLMVFFGLAPQYPQANLRHYHFMLEGLIEVSKALEKRGIQFVSRVVSPEQGIIDFCKEVNAALLICDKGYLRIQRKWRKYVLGRLDIEMVEVESDTVVPVETASDQEEFTARTLRPKIKRLLGNFLQPLKLSTLKNQSLTYRYDTLKLHSVSSIIQHLEIDRSVLPSVLKGGRSEALKHLSYFLEKNFDRYSRERNEPSAAVLSQMSPYLHFGQISSLEIALMVKDFFESTSKHRLSEQVLMAGSSSKLTRNKLQDLEESFDAYLEELIVRRELSINFCYYNQDYDVYDKALPRWALKTLDNHKNDKRGHLYSVVEFEAAETHDEIWNACQREMVQTGKMHGYMRMYWGKKMLEWSKTPEEGFNAAVYLNDKYEIDGRDANSYAGVAWCFGKHDRPWGPERPIFGLVRYMNESGIKRKIDWETYVRQWS